MYIVLSNTGNLAMPVAVKWQPEGVVVPANGIFHDRAVAKRFAEYCARRHPGSKYHLMGCEATVCTVVPDVAWEDTP